MTTAVDHRSVGALLRREVVRLRPVSDSAALDARLLVAHGLGRTAGDLPLIDDRAASAEEEGYVRALVDRRIAGEPVARIVGEKEFWGLSFGLSAETLVPRPDTEAVVEAVLCALGRSDRLRDHVTILDLGTGSGAILLALLSELPAASGLGIDRSAGAVATARNNAERIGLGDRALFAAGDWGTAVSARFDVAVANPPYINTATIVDLPLEVRRYDPHLALDGGPDGFDSHRRIVADLGRLLAPHARGFVEIGAGQAPGFTRLAAGRDFETRVHRDIARVGRVVELWLPG